MPDILSIFRSLSNHGYEWEWKQLCWENPRNFHSMEWNLIEGNVQHGAILGTFGSICVIKGYIVFLPGDSISCCGFVGCICTSSKHERIWRVKAAFRACSPRDWSEEGIEQAKAVQSKELPPRCTECSSLGFISDFRFPRRSFLFERLVSTSTSWWGGRSVHIQTSESKLQAGLRSLKPVSKACRFCPFFALFLLASYCCGSAKSFVFFLQRIIVLCFGAGSIQQWM